VTRHGMGKDIWNVPFDDITLMLKVRPSAMQQKRYRTPQRVMD
jgi:hypothetical protein